MFNNIEKLKTFFIEWKQNQFNRGAFKRNFLIMLTGVSFSQGIIIIIAPILTRLYTPENFGILALFVSISAIFAIVSCLRYELAIMLPPKKEEAANIFALALLATIGMSILCLLFIIFFGHTLAGWLKTAYFSSWLLGIPLFVFFAGLYEAIKHWSSRKKQFKQISISLVGKSGSSAVTQVTMGIFSISRSIGLIFGYIIGQIIATLILGAQVWRDDKKFFKSSVKLSEIKKAALRYKNFPIYMNISGLINTGALQLPPIFIFSFFSPIEAGFYAISHRLLSVPIGLVGKSLRDIFFQKTAELYQTKESLRSVTLKLIRNLFLIGIIPFLVIILFGPKLFSIILGQNWGIAGTYAQILSPFFLSQFSIAPISIIFSVTENQKASLFWQIGFFLITIISFGFGRVLGSVKTALLFYSLGGCFMYLIMMFLCLRFVQISPPEMLIHRFSKK